MNKNLFIKKVVLLKAPDSCLRMIGQTRYLVCLKSTSGLFAESCLLNYKDAKIRYSLVKDNLLWFDKLNESKDNGETWIYMSWMFKTVKKGE